MKIRCPFLLPAALLIMLPLAAKSRQNRVTWNTKAGTVSAVLTSDSAQTLALVLPPDATVDSLTVDGHVRQATAQGIRTQGCTLKMPKGKAVTVHAKFHFKSAKLPA